MKHDAKRHAEVLAALESIEPQLTPERVRELLRQGANSATELQKLIAPCFRLNERSASLRLD